MNIEELKKRIEDWQFISVPTEEQEPFFWRWTEEGLDTLAEYITKEIKQAYDKGYADGWNKYNEAPYNTLNED